MITLFTLCPECKKEHAITVKQLRISRAIVECKHCGIKFDALELLNDTPKQRPVKPNFARPDSALPPLPWENKDSPRTAIRWDWGCYVAGLFLLIQVYWFQGYNLTQNPTIRPLLEGVCALSQCSVTPYDNIDEFKIIHGALLPDNEHQLIFQATFSNSAKFAQAYPGLRLTLLRYNGDILGRRIFWVNEYLPNSRDKTISADQQVSIKLRIAMPPEPIGGYKFELT